MITEGVAAPVQVADRFRPALSSAAAAANLGGSSTTPLSLTPQHCAPTNTQEVVVTYTVTGRQDNPASFKVNSTWTFNGSIWTPSVPVTVNVATRLEMFLHRNPHLPGHRDPS